MTRAHTGGNDINANRDKMKDVAIPRFSLANSYSDDFVLNRLKSCDVNTSFRQEPSTLVVG